MNGRRRLLIVLCTTLLVTALGSLAQKPGKVWRVGFLSSRSRPVSMDTDYYGEFPKRMRELGYVEGKDLVIEWRFAEGKYEHLPELVADLIKLPVDLIVTDGANSAQAAQKATTTIPIVFSTSGDPVALGLVKSLARPGGNATGIAILSNDTSVKQIEMLHSMVPGLARVGVLLNPEDPNAAHGLKALQAAAETIRMKILPLEVRNAGDMESAFGVMTKEHAGAFVVLPNEKFSDLIGQLVRLELEHHLPGMGYPRFGGLFYYGENLWDMTAFKATCVDKILRGAKRQDLPVQQPTKIELVINRKTAKALGLTIPPELLLLADKVIE